MAELLHELLFNIAAHSPEQTAIVHDRHGTLSYGDLATCVKHFADAVTGLGLERRDRVATMVANDHETCRAVRVENGHRRRIAVTQQGLLPGGGKLW